MTWSEKFEAKIANNSHGMRVLFNRKRADDKRYPYNFDITVDYEMRGYIHSITLETEHDQSKFDMRELVIQVIHRLDQAGCLNPYKNRDTSLLAEVLSHLDIPLNSDLPSLNRVLALPEIEIRQGLMRYMRDRNDSSIATDDRLFAQDVLQNRKKYIHWLIEVNEIPGQSGLANMLGRNNIERKLQVISALEANNGESTSSAN